MFLSCCKKQNYNKIDLVWYRFQKSAHTVKLHLYLCTEFLLQIDPKYRETQQNSMEFSSAKSRAFFN